MRIALLACAAFFFLPDKPLPPPPTKAQLFNTVSGQLGLERILTEVISHDPYLSAELAKARIDIATAPFSQSLPHSVLAWPGQNRYQLALVDSQAKTEPPKAPIATAPEPDQAEKPEPAPDRSEEVLKKLALLQKSVDELGKTIAQRGQEAHRAIGETQALIMELGDELRKKIEPPAEPVREPHPFKPAKPLTPSN